MEFLPMVPVASAKRDTSLEHYPTRLNHGEISGAIARLRLATACADNTGNERNGGRRTMADANSRALDDDEVLRYWIPRLVADGGDANDALAVRARAATWDDWPGAWATLGDGYRGLAGERSARGHGLSAAEALVRAAICYHFGQVVAFHLPAVKTDLQGRKIAAFRDAAPLLAPPAIRLDIPFGVTTLPGYLRLPADADGPVACVLLVPGLDSTKEDFATIMEMCVRRGLAAFAFDGPGQGEVHPRLLLGDGYEDCIVAAFDAMAARPEIDPARIGTLGRSLGGIYVVKAAAAEPRIAATVVFGGAWDLGDWPTMPELIRAGFVWATGAASEEEVLACMVGATLDGCTADVKTPVLIVHGRHDAIFKAAQAERIAAALPDNATLWMDEAGVHCCHNHAFEYRTGMVDWLAETL
jgi:2,6-dihydroxypseudooxynicotine hydrolase